MARLHFIFCLLLILLSAHGVSATGLAHDWSQRFGNSTESYGYSVAVDDLGNVIVAGYFWGTVDFGGGPLTSAGAWDIFVAKFDASGNPLWSRRFGDAVSQYGQSVAVDGSDNVIVTGFFSGTVDFGSGPLSSAGSGDIFVAKFDASGNPLWSRRFGDAIAQYGRSVAVDDLGNVIVSGEFDGTVDFGGGALTSSGGNDIYVAKFDAGGNPLWSQRFGDADPQQYGYSVAADGSGNVILTGEFDGTVDFGGGALTSAGATDIFVAKFDAGGNPLWSQRFGDASIQYAYGVAVDGSDNVVVTGNFEGTVDFGGGPLTSAGGEDIYVAKFDSSGDPLWSQRFGDAFVFQSAYGVAADGSGNVVVAGAFQGTVDFGGGPLTSVGVNDIYLARFDAGGAHLWSRRFGDDGDQVGRSVAADGSGNVIVTGNFQHRVDFGGGPLTSSGHYDIFVARFSPAEVTGVGGDDIPRANYLLQNAPNPFNPGTQITFGVREAGEVSLRIYDASGRLVRVLAEGRWDAGPHVIEWNGQDALRQPVASGVYFCRLDVAGETLSRKLVLLR